MADRKVTISKHPDINRPSRWRVSYLDPERKKKSKFFKTRAEAEIYGEAVENQIRNFGLQAFSLPESAKHDAQRALEVLAPYGKTLLDAARFYAAHLERTEKSCSVDDLRDAFLAEKEALGLSRRHLEDLRSRTSRFAAAFKGTLVGGITTDQVTDWLNQVPGGAHTRQNARRVLHSLFAYAVRRQKAQSNPVAHTAPIRIPDHEVSVFTPDEMQALLNNADPAIVPYIAMGAFAGLRSAELLRLSWEAVEFATGYIRVSGDIAKTRSKRLIPLSPNLRAWLTPHAKGTGSIVPDEKKWKLRILFHEACEKAGIAWKNNALRHSYGTYRMAVTGDAARTSLEMGNSPNIVFKHYRELVTSEIAQKFWNISSPTTPELRAAA